MKLYVINEINPKEQIGLWQSFFRNLDFIICIVFFPLLIIDYIFAVFNKNKKRALEYLSKSKVIVKIGV
jgi:hypothetical protein